MIPWEVLPLAFSVGAIVGGVLGHAQGRLARGDYEIAKERSGVAAYFRAIDEPDHDHEH